MKRVALYAGPGVGPKTLNMWVNHYRQGGIFPPEVDLWILRPEDFTPERLADFHCVLLPGGSGSKICKGLGESGRAALVTATESGLSVMGICAGAYAMLSGYEWSLGMLDWKILDRVDLPMGSKNLQLSYSDQWQHRLDQVWYHNGPVMVPCDAPGRRSTPIATFLSPIYESGSHVGAELGTPAILMGTCGKGRVVAISPHPEQTPNGGVILLPLFSYLLDC